MTTIAKNKYYEIDVDKSKNRMYLKIIGFWKYSTEVADYINDIKKATNAISKGFSILADLREMKTPAKEIEVLHKEAQTLLIQAGLDRTAEVHNSAITKLSTKKYADTSGMKKQEFATIKEAEEWLG